MSIPGKAAALSALAAMQDGTAVVLRSRVDAAANSVVTETVYEGLRCHLSSRRGLGVRQAASLKQTAAQAQAAAGYTVFFGPGIVIQPGDLITVCRAGQTVRGRAGLPDYGALGITVALDGVEIA